MNNSMHQCLSNLNSLTKMFSADCKWSEWGKWGSCSEKCGGGTQLRTRFISQPSLNGGKACTGSSSEEQACNTKECPSKGMCSLITSSLSIDVITGINFQQIAGGVSGETGAFAPEATNCDLGASNKRL